MCEIRNTKYEKAFILCSFVVDIRGNPWSTCPFHLASPQIPYPPLTETEFGCHQARAGYEQLLRNG